MTRTAVKHLRNMEEISIGTAFKHIENSLAIFGINHGRIFTGCKTYKWLSIVYSVAVNLLLWTNALRYIPSLWKLQTFDGDSVLSVLVTLMFIASALITTCHFRNCSNHERYRTLDKMWENYLALYDGGSMPKLRQRVVATTVASWTSVLFGFIMIIVNTTLNPSSLAILAYPAKFSDTYFMAVRASFNITCVYIFAVNVFITTHAYLYCYYLYSSFAVFTQKVRDEIKRSSAIEIRRFKIQHQYLCRINDLTDSVCSGYIFIQYLFGSAEVLIEFYILFWFPDVREKIGLPTLLLCLVLCTFGVASLSVIGMKINNEVSNFL